MALWAITDLAKYINAIHTRRWIFVFVIIISMASSAAFTQPEVRIIQYDMGGVLSQRVEQVEKMRVEGTAVHIVGTCVSACTLFLGLPNTCVTANAVLGFHGPRTRIPGVPLPREDFDRETNLMATYYPTKIRYWFMTEARLITESYYTISGTQAVAMGAHLCP